MAGWTLAIDYGTTSSAAAVQAGGQVRLVEVGGSPRVPSLVVAAPDGSLLAGAVAAREAPGAAERAERAPKRRIGDRAVVLGEHRVEPADMVAATLRHLADEARRHQGGADPDEVRLTHPASWAGTRVGVLRAAAERAGLGSARCIPEPVAAALHYAGDEVPVGGLVAVYDLGGGTFDTAVLRRTDEGFELVGPPGGSDRLGGEDFDERLYQHIGATIAAEDADAWEQLRYSTERAWARANAALRAEATAAKEALSTAAETTVYVPAPVDRDVRVTREELEQLIAPELGRTVDELVATVGRAGATLEDLAAVYLVGGSSRIPLVTRLVAERVGDVPATWGDPKAVVVLGAAAAPAAALDAEAPPAVPVTARTPAIGADPTVPLAVPAGDGPTVSLEVRAGDGPAAPVPVAGAPGGEEPGPDLAVPGSAAPARRRPLAFLAGALAGVLALVAAVVVVAGGDDPDELADPVVVGDDREDGEDGEDGDADPEGDGTERLQLAQDAEVTGDLRSQRTFRFIDDDLQSVTRLTNQGDAPLSLAWFEVIPKELAPTAADATYVPEPDEVVDDDPVLLWRVTVAPGETERIFWSPRELPEGAEQSMELLEEVAELHAAAVAAATPVIEAKRYELAAAAQQAGEELALPENGSGSGGGWGTTGGFGGTGGDGGDGGDGGSSTTGDGGGGGTSTGGTTTGSTGGTTTGGTTTGGTTTTKPPTTTTVPPKPGAPSNVVAANPSGPDGGVAITLSWSHASGTVTSYRIRGQAWGRTFQSGDCVGDPKALGSALVVDTVGAPTSWPVSPGTRTEYACSWMVYDVWALNSGVEGSPSRAQFLVPSRSASFQQVRAAGGWAISQDNCGSICEEPGEIVPAGRYAGAS